MQTGRGLKRRAKHAGDAPGQRFDDDSDGRPRGRPVRVLVLNERCHANPLAGGVEVSLFERFRRVAQRGIAVELLCSGFPGAAPTEVHQGVRVSRVGSRLSYYAQVPGEVRRRVHAGEVDVVVEELSKVPFLSPLYAGVPVMAVHHHLHGMTAFRQVSAGLALGSMALEATIPWVYRHAPVITVSKSSKSDLVRRGLPEEHIDVVPNGLDHDLLRPARITGRRPLIVSLGRLEPYKRLDLLLRTMPRILAEVPRARLAILGRGQDEGRLKTLVADLGLTNTVEFAGHVTESQKAAWLQAAALHVQCSSKEGWGLTVMEAAACGTPVVATDVPGLSDSVQDGVTGLLVRRARPPQLASAITRLLTDDAERSRLGHNALAWSRNFRWEPFAAAIEKAVRQAADRAAEPREVEMPRALAPAEVAA